ncbi:MAG: SpoIIE family protein phosphatase [Clostridia bacterium]|nr:SpoIIE family protein phosphatase [Clostridia bacterium]
MKRFSAVILLGLLLCCSCYAEPDTGNPFPLSFSLSQSQNNAESGRPYEDAFYAHGTAFVVADGVSRTDNEYLDMTESPAAFAAERVAAIVGKILQYAKDPATASKTAARRASAAVGRYNRQTGLSVPAATSYVSAVIRNGKLYYSYIGDNHLILLRNGAATEFCEKQTDAVHRAGGAYGLGMSREEYYRTVVNNAAYPGGLGYGVITGSSGAYDFLRTGTADLFPGDRILLASDGLDVFLENAAYTDLKSFSAEELLSMSAPYDSPPFGSYAHDKTLIAIDIG